MIKLKGTRSAFAALILASLATLVSCAQDPIGIFASLGQERPIGADSTKALSATSPSSMARFSLDGVPYFFMASGYIHYRPMTLAAGAWKQVPGLTDLPETASRCLQIAAADRLYAAWLDENYASLGLFASADAETWTAIAPATPDVEEDVELVSSGGVAREITKLFAVNGIVFVGTKESFVEGSDTVVRFKLYRVSGDGAVECPIDAGGAPLQYNKDLPYDASAIRSLAYDGSSYWFVSGSSLFRGSGGGTPSFSRIQDEAGMLTGVSLTSVSWSPELGRLLVASGSGMFDVDGTLTGRTPGLIFARLPDGSWEASAPSVLVSNAATGGYANFTDLVAVPGASGHTVIVASSSSSIKYGAGKEQSNKAAEARGYGILAPNPDSGSITDRPAEASTVAAQSEITSWSFYETTLKNLAVTRLYYMDVADGSTILFACTSGKGLWSNTRGPSGEWGGWVKE